VDPGVSRGFVYLPFYFTIDFLSSVSICLRVDTVSPGSAAHVNPFQKSPFVDKHTTAYAAQSRF